MEYKIITGNPTECEKEMNLIKREIEIKSIDTKFGKYGVDYIMIVIAIKSYKQDI